MTLHWAWQNYLDFWSLAHAWGWAAGSWAVAWWVRPLRREVSQIFVAAVMAGVLWEVVEASWIEPWLAFAEPWGNRVADVVLDALGAWVGLRTALDKQLATG